MAGELPLYTSDGRFPHLIVPYGGEAERFKRKSIPIKEPALPQVDRPAQYRKVREQFEDAFEAMDRVLAGREKNLAEGKPGFYLEFSTLDDVFHPKRLERLRSNAEVLAARPDGDHYRGALYLPKKARKQFLRRIEQYGNDGLRKDDLPRHAEFVGTLDEVRVGNLASIWIDDRDIPEPGEVTWFELWIRKSAVQRFMNIAEKLELELDRPRLQLPGRYVGWTRTTRDVIERIMVNCDAVAEVRLGLDDLRPFPLARGDARIDVREEAARRIVAPPAGSPAVCVLDTGTTVGHHLLAAAIGPGRAAAVPPMTDPADFHGHGTLTSGAVLFGDVRETFRGADPIELRHGFESVKIVEASGAPAKTEALAKLTQAAVGIIESLEPHRPRVFCVASTLTKPQSGNPSTWSVEIDQQSADQTHRRLFVLAAGNVRENYLNDGDYPAVNDVEQIEDPGQAWNALTVGGYTGRTAMAEANFAGWRALAADGGLSPHSRTAVNWSGNRRRYFKPDVVMEAGNWAAAPGSAHRWGVAHELAMMSTSNDLDQFVDVFGATSAAAAQGALLAAEIMAENPKFWPETVRGLIVHSAQWTPAMVAQAAGTSRKTALQRWGHGVPRRDWAIASARDRLTLVHQQTTQPFRYDSKNTGRANEMVLHRLPLPADELRALEGAEVELRLTLSYFVEPNAPSKTYGYNRSYASHRFNFALKRPNEDVDQLRARINAAVTDTTKSEELWAGDGWLYGRDRSVGSVVSDSLRIDARTLAERDAIGVMPVGGWWRDMKDEFRVESRTRYSLIVSLRLLAQSEIDIYSPIANRIGPLTIDVDR